MADNDDRPKRQPTSRARTRAIRRAMRESGDTYARAARSHAERPPGSEQASRDLAREILRYIGAWCGDLAAFSELPAPDQHDRLSRLQRLMAIRLSEPPLPAPPVKRALVPTAELAGELRRLCGALGNELAGCPPETSQRMPLQLARQIETACRHALAILPSECRPE